MYRKFKQYKEERKMYAMHNGERVVCGGQKYWEYCGSKTGFNDMCLDCKARRDIFKRHCW